MSISEYAKRYAIDYALTIWAAADPTAYLGEGSEIRHLLIMPIALIHSALHQELESIRAQSIGSPDTMSEQAYDELYTNFPGSVRQQGTPSIVTVRLILARAAQLRLEVFPYFVDVAGNRYSPQQPQTYQPADARLNDQGELYIDVPCFSQALGVSVNAGEINKFSGGLPTDIIRRVTNPAAATAGRSRPSNAEYNEQQKRERSDGTLVQAGGMVQFVRATYPQSTEALVVGAGDAAMMRDELFSTDGIVANFVRQGTPFALHLALGTLEFDVAYGRAVAAAPIFTSDMVGRRVAVVGDAERYRTILRVVSDVEVVLSGDPLTGSAAAVLWADGPHTGGKVDLYVYFPALHAFSVVVDRRYRLQTSRLFEPGDTRIYVEPVAGVNYNTLPATGVVALFVGTSNATKITGTTGSDLLGTYLTVDAGDITSQLAVGTQLNYWPLEPITVKPDGDVSNVPLLFVESIEELDPVTLEPIGDIAESAAGPYASPGWYVSTPDGAEVFSTREDKHIVLDDKFGFSSYAPIETSGASIIGTSQVAGSRNTLQRVGVNFEGTEGREVTIQVPIRTINQANIASAPVAAISADRKRLTLTGAAVQVFTEDGWRTGVSVAVSSGTFLFASYTLTQCRLVGNTLERTDGGVFVGAAADYNPVAITFPGAITRPAYELEAVIAVGRQDEIEVIALAGLKAIWNGSAVTTPGVVIFNNDPRPSFTSAPVRVNYYSHPDFLRLQEVLDDGGNRLVARDILARSFLPAKIDIAAEYRGQATPSELQRRVVELLQLSQQQRPEGAELRIDLSRIVDALAEEGLTTSFQLNFEVKVTYWLDDGEKVVRYLNPGPATAQQMTLAAAAAPGDTLVRLKQVRPGLTPPGRGRIVLGGFNPDAMETLPYEAVLVEEDGSFTFLLRGDKELDYAHAQWEGARVGVRDWEPELEFEGQEIVIPATCRPYIGQANFVRRG